MKKFIDLLNFEMGRFLKYLLPTFLVVAILQLFTTFTTINSYNDEARRMLAQGQDLASMPPFTGVTITQRGLFGVSIMGLVLVFVFYSFFIWYREWLGKNAFIYRLLMLPVNRTMIFLTKALAFLIGGFLSFVFQFGMYGLVLFISERMVQPEIYQAVNIHQIRPMYDMVQYALFPETVIEFIATYGFAFGALVTLFTAILLERSYRLKGLIAGIVYFIGYFALYSMVSVSNYIDFIPFIIRPSQAYIASIIYLLVTMAVGTFISSRLLKNKVKV